MTSRSWLGVAVAGLLVTTGCETLNRAAPIVGSLFTQQELTVETIVAGLKEALRVGTQNTVATTGRAGGYGPDTAIHIPLPPELTKLASTLRNVGLGQQVDLFEAKMNEAAEQAAAQAAPIFVDAITQMSFADAKGILQGGPTAATDYFRSKTSDRLTELYRPIVQQKLTEVGAVKVYQNLLGRYNQIPLVPKPQFTPDAYVTGKGIDGLFTVLAGEERKIRENPAARTTELLRTVFGRQP
jgi:hypothetical protein